MNPFDSRLVGECGFLRHQCIYCIDKSPIGTVPDQLLPCFTLARIKRVRKVDMSDTMDSLRRRSIHASRNRSTRSLLCGVTQRAQHATVRMIQPTDVSSTLHDTRPRHQRHAARDTQESRYIPVLADPRKDRSPDKRVLIDFHRNALIILVIRDQQPRVCLGLLAQRVTVKSRRYNR